MDENPQRTENHSLSEKQTDTDNHKTATTIAALTDPKFPLPALEKNTSTLQYIRSFATLFALLGGGIVGAWFLEVTILQSSQPIVLLSCIFAVVVGALFLTGTIWVDWFELVLGYWWLSMPIGAFAGLALVLNQQATAGIEEIS